MVAPEKALVTVLAVDDEPANLQLLERVFHAHPEWRYLSASAPERGIEVLKQNVVDVLLVDFVMPTANGVEFLTRAAQISPTSVAIMVTAFGELKAVLAALDKGLVQQVVTKPWLAKDIETAVSRALTVRWLRTTAQRLRDLPTH